ncbi:uncharacterized protein LOC129584968 [Paramacrobiotus metropolitanus]|uniref:uncharacterized protein LOC129584968 n=1 Tax=Paramacrobiotus metropolitanus TaxID=2943436 RepID=UPI00244585B8|nr:uncharacterized protein LOC129584968 [Paramacrobiotus metropolitanus]
MDKSSLIAILASAILMVVMQCFAVPVPALDDADLFDQSENVAPFFPVYDRRTAYSGPEMAEMKLMASLAADDASAVKAGVPSPATYPDNYSILPPIKRTPPRDVRSRSILCYFNSVSCFGGRRQNT